MLILDKLRAMDLLVARSERIDVPEEFRWGPLPGAAELLPWVQDAEGRRRLAHALVLRPATAVRVRPETDDGTSAPPPRRVAGAHRRAMSLLHP